MSEGARDFPLIGSSPAFLAALEHVSLAAPLDRPVMVIGERGTGKELIAARLHFLSRRWDRALIKLNCAALAESLLETELFGYEAGAFTGATRKHAGRFELANGGTLFLDEIAMMSPRVQEKLLRVLEYGEFERVGGRETIQVDVRVVGATNVDLPERAARGEFREDLLDRLAFDVITLPPLRARSEDLLPLAEHYANRMSRELKREYFAGFSRDAQASLLAYGWPGNVRELKNVVERAVYRNTDPEAQVESFSFDPFASPYRLISAQPAKSLPLSPVCAPAESPNATAAERASEPSGDSPFAFEDCVREVEIRWIKRALEVTRFNQKRCAEHLGMSYHQLRGYLRKYKLNAGEDEPN